jgi:Lipopolysaccharide assembly protein A domain
MRQSAGRRLEAPGGTDVRREPDDPNDAIRDDTPSAGYRREGLGGKATGFIGAGIVLLVFFLQNLDTADINFLFWDWDVAIALAIGIAAVLGFVLGWGFAWMRRRARRS